MDSETLAETQKENESLKQKVHLLEERVQKLTRKLGKKKTELADLRASNDRMFSKLAKTEAANRIALKEVEEQKKTSREMQQATEREIKEKEEKIKEKQGVLIQKDKEISELVKETKGLKEKMEKMEKEIGFLREKANGFSKEPIGTKEQEPDESKGRGLKGKEEAVRELRWDKLSGFERHQSQAERKKGKGEKFAQERFDKAEMIKAGDQFNQSTISLRNQKREGAVVAEDQEATLKREKILKLKETDKRAHFQESQSHSDEKQRENVESVFIKVSPKDFPMVFPSGNEDSASFHDGSPPLNETLPVLRLSSLLSSASRFFIDQNIDVHLKWKTIKDKKSSGMNLVMIKTQILNYSPHELVNFTFLVKANSRGGIALFQFMLDWLCEWHSEGIRPEVHVIDSPEQNAAETRRTFRSPSCF